MDLLAWKANDLTRVETGTNMDKLEHTGTLGTKTGIVEAQQLTVGRLAIGCWKEVGCMPASLMS